MEREEKLIELVREHHALYDTSDPNHMKSKFKSEIWTQIANEMNTNGEEVKAVWTKLRNNHRDALRRQKRMIKSGAAAGEIKPWKFQSQMEFLLTYMVNENRETNFNNEDDHSQPPQDHLRESDTQNFDEQIADDNDEGLAQLNTAHVEDDDSLDLPAREHAESPTPRKNLKRKVKKSDVDNLMKKTLEQRSKERDEKRKKLEAKIAPTDDLHLFFLSMYELTKRMPPSSQHIVRRNVFLTVSQEEARLLNISEPTFFPQQHFPQGSSSMGHTHQPSDNWSNWSLMSPTETNNSGTSPSSVRPPSNSSEGTMDSNLQSSNLVSYINNYPN